MGGLNVESADSYYHEDSETPPYFIVEQCEYHIQSLEIMLYSN